MHRRYLTFRTTEAISRVVWFNSACSVSSHPEVGTAIHGAVTLPSIEEIQVDSVDTSELSTERESLPSRVRIVAQTNIEDQSVMEPEKLCWDSPLVPATSVLDSAMHNITGIECTVGENDAAASHFGASMPDESEVCD
jgi:hypothetical protein